MAKPNPNDFRVLPPNDEDLIPFYIGGDVSKPFWIKWKDVKRILASALPSGSGVLLKTNGVTNPVQTLLNLIAGTNMTITNDGLGNITFTSSGGGGGTYTADNGIAENSPTPNNFRLGGSIVTPTTITSGASSSSNGIRFDAPVNLPTGSGIYSFTGFNLSGLYNALGNSILASFFAQGAISVKITASESGGITGTGLLIESLDSLSNPLKIKGSVGDTLLFNDNGQLRMHLYNSATAFSGVSGASVGLLNVDNQGKVFVSPAPSGTGTVTNVATGTGLTGGPITNTGTISLNSKLAPADSLTGNALKFLRVNAGETAVEYANVTSSNLNDTTGILFGGALSATIGGTTFSVTAGIGQIVTQTASIAGVVTTVSNVTWSAVTGAAITNIGTSQFTYVLVNSSGTVIQQTTPFTDAQYKTHIIIGILCHINLASVNLVTNSQNVAYEDPHRLVELISAFGPIKKTGLNIGPNGANLRVNRASGEAFKIGANYITDQFEPDVAIISAKIPAKLCRAYGNNSVGFTFDTFGGLFYDDIDPNQYFNPTTGVLNSVGGSKWTIQRLFFFPNNPDDIICYYGVQVYNQFSEARANLEFETFDEATITAENAVFLGFLFVRHNATALNNPTQAAFLQSGLFRGIPPGGGGSGGGGNSIGELTGDITAGPAISPSESVAATLAPNYKEGSCGVTFDSDLNVIQPKTAYVQIPYNGILTSWSMVADQAGACTIAVSKGTFGVFPTSSAVYVTNPAIPATNQTATNPTPAYNVGMNVVTAGDVIKFEISAITAITWVNFSISITKTL
jgi:hypothetical protein